MAASDNSDQLASWSNWSTRIISIAAPGTNIHTTRMGGGYWNVSGTSAAAPVVTGVAGLLKSIRRSTNTQLISKALFEGARPSASLAGKVTSGGVVNAANALAELHGAAQSPPFLPPGYGNGGGFRTTPPPPITSTPISNLPNLDQARNTQPEQSRARVPIQSNLMCADCDPQGGGGGGGNHPSGDANFSAARIKLRNETGQEGVDLGSGNFNWSLALLSLPGRAGLDLNLTLFYNSLVWTKDGFFIKFNADLGSPAPGFRLGFPILQRRFLNSQTGIHAYLLMLPSGGRVELRQIGTNNYESQDSRYTHLDDSNPNALVVRTTDGTQFTFTPVTINNEYRCTKIKDRNGNYISATYNTTNGHLLTIKDTLNREIIFDYDGNNNLQAIRQTWGQTTHLWATFYYGQVLVAPAFSAGLLVNGPNNNYTTVLTQVNLHDGSYFTFNYNDAFAQVKRINHYAADSHLLSYTSYNVTSSSGQTDCPRFTERREWTEHWNNGNEAITNYSVATDNSGAQQTAPDGTIYKELYGSSGWKTGLTIRTEVWSLGVEKKWTTINWTQDDTNLSYRKNPRVTETTVEDPAGNKRRVTIDYYDSGSFNLPSDVKEYNSNGTSLLRRTHTDYNLNPEYTNRRIIGLVLGQSVYDGTGALKTKTMYRHDWAAPWLEERAGAVQHDDANYGIGFVVGRGNLVLVERWDVNHPDDYSRVLTTKFGYNTIGSLTFTGDGLWHRTDFSYTDSFSDGQNHNTFAYPTTITDPDSFSSTVKYNYDFGAVTRRQDPKGAVQTITYDATRRIDRITNETNGAYIRYVYAPSGYIATFATVQNGAGEAYEISYFDGAGRLRASGGDHPGSANGYSGQLIFYDIMGRVSQQTNPAEINASWAPSGDDQAGWASTLRTYDWNGRPLQTTNPDGTTRENTYGGCGCAGGEQTTVRDERGRRKKYTKDALSRLIKVEELNWNESVYATTNYTYNVHDQLLQINQAGQPRTFAYDGYSRLIQRSTPEQGNTTYSYLADDSLQTVTDARGASTTFGYNNRGLVTSITYGVPVDVAATANVSFGYDSARNRTSMTDGLGSVSYVYNTLSQLTSETRNFTNVGSFTLSYAYNLTGQLTSITNQSNAQVGYTYDKTGRLTNVSGSGYSGVSSYVNSIAYRALGLKQMTYNNGRTLSLQYDNRLRVTQWNIPGVMGWNYAYNYFGENTGRVTYAQNLNDATLDRSYHYDQVGRLQSAFTGSSARAHVGIGSNWLSDGPYAAQDNVYDTWGNTLSRTGWGGANPQYSASYTNNKMNGMTYDDAGNLEDAGGGWTFTYDATGQQATSAVGNVEMVYDGDRLRGKKKENGLVTYYLRSSVLGGQVVAELSSAGSWSRGYVYLGGEILAVQQGGVYWMHEDPVAKSKRVTNASGNVVSTIELDPWGGETNRSSNEVFQPRKFTTYGRDSIGSDDAMHRRYNRWWARFEQPDPYDGSYNLTNPQSFNRYAYVNNDPVNFVDPSGLNPQDPPPTTHIDPATGLPFNVPGVIGGTVTVGPDPLSGLIGAGALGSNARAQLLGVADESGSGAQQNTTQTSNADPNEQIHCDPKVRSKIVDMLQEALRTRTEAGFRVNRDPNTGDLSPGPIDYGQSGTEVTVKGITQNTVAMFHTHSGSPDPSFRDKQNARGEGPAFKGTPLYGHKSVQYVQKVGGRLTLYNGANPKDAKGRDRVIDDPPCPQ